MFSPRRFRNALDTALAILVVCFVALAVTSGIRTATGDATFDVADGPPPRGAVQPVGPLDDYAVIAARDVFNPAATSGPGAAQGLRLWGVALHGEDAVAVIADAETGRQELYRLGDVVAGGARITAITWDQVTLARDGGEDATLEVLPADAATVPAAAGDEPAPPAASPSIRRTGPDAYIVDRRGLVGTVDNMSGLMTQLRAVAEVHDGRPAGFRLFQIKDDSIFRRLGLENGDVVKRVNGDTVADPTTLLAFLERLRSEPRVALEIVRAGDERTLVYDLR